jgi:hypothetical protein
MVLPAKKVVYTTRWTPIATFPYFLKSSETRLPRLGGVGFGAAEVEAELLIPPRRLFYNRYGKGINKPLSINYTHLGSWTDRLKNTGVRRTDLAFTLAPSPCVLCICQVHRTDLERDDLTKQPPVAPNLQKQCN